MRWLFPKNRKAEANSVLDQCLKIREEGNETFAAALNKEGDSRIIEEALDTMQTVEGLLRKFPVRKVAFVRVMVVVKCMKRGDYL